MLKHERFEYILDKLQTLRKIDAATLSHELQISEATVRRDLTELDILGKIRKVHGGAVLASSPSFKQRTHINQEIKVEIARKALPLLEYGQVIMIDGGTTNLQLVKLIPEDFQATIVTNSPTIAQQFNHHPQIQVILSGGQYFKPNDVLVGPAACDMIREIHADICLLGICSLHPIQGVTTSFYEEAQVKKSMISSSLHVVALANADKLGQCENFKVCDTKQIETIVTELNPEEDKLNSYKQLHIRIV